MSIEIMFVCKDCGKRCGPVYSYITGNTQDGTCRVCEWHLGHVTPPANWGEHCDGERCKECHDNYYAKMRPLWQAEREAKQALLNAEIKRMYADDRPALIEKLKKWGPINDSNQREMLSALIECLNSTK